ncbi:uncharacterized protein LOC126908391 [Daktulosphaira vitifoliae]|uniref:uncharacterized protein LOC126908391 n=1 Tax=Daktulosphaira vitifoliae TaxID=58002 RepID=UPI0021A9F886|nr:uncharacterized protein LOC126908391 [Daktulosphaira vitifoliae]
MYLLKLYTFSFVFFSVILYTKADPALKKTVDQFHMLLKYSGWKNLKDLVSIKLRRETHYVKDLIVIPTHRNKCHQKIRALTVCIGCIYVKFINKISLVISNILQMCQKKILEDLINGCICTEELVYILTLLIVPLTTLMQGAINALNSIRINSSLKFANRHCTISNLLETFGNILEILNYKALSRDNVSTYFWTLNYIDSFIINTLNEIQAVTNIYCEFVSYDTNDLWNNWVQEYEAFIDHEDSSVFLKFIKKKIKDNVMTVIKEQYLQLGFIFDPITEETFAATLDDPIELELELAINEEHPAIIKIKTSESFNQFNIGLH